MFLCQWPAIIPNAPNNNRTKVGAFSTVSQPSLINKIVRVPMNAMTSARSRRWPSPEIPFKTNSTTSKGNQFPWCIVCKIFFPWIKVWCKDWTWLYVFLRTCHSWLEVSPCDQSGNEYSFPAYMYTIQEYRQRNWSHVALHTSSHLVHCWTQRVSLTSPCT